MAHNKVVYGTSTLIDLTSDTVTAANIEEGVTAHDKAGEPIVGTLKTRDSYASTTPASLFFDGKEGDLFFHLVG